MPNSASKKSVCYEVWNAGCLAGLGLSVAAASGFSGLMYEEREHPTDEERVPDGVGRRDVCFASSEQRGAATREKDSCPGQVGERSVVQDGWRGGCCQMNSVVRRRAWVQNQDWLSRARALWKARTTSVTVTLVSWWPDGHVGNRGTYDASSSETDSARQS